MSLLFEILFYIFLICNTLCVIVVIGGFLEDLDVTLSFVNPKVIYNSIKVNWFGCIILTIIINIGLPVASVPYWIYKVCTIGRR